jgi:hypothetical protein
MPAIALERDDVQAMEAIRTSKSDEQEVISLAEKIYSVREGRPLRRRSTRS